MSYPPWVVLHVPHDSTVVPVSLRSQFVLDDEALAAELRRMTDHRTHALFVGTAPMVPVVRAPVSRLVVDVERFADDTEEPMAARGMGAVYMQTSMLAPLRRPLAAGERAALLADYYHPHHARLEGVADALLRRYGRCLVLDCHSFPSRALPYELAAPDAVRPDICIGTDSFHTPAFLAEAFAAAFRRAGWQVDLNSPFGGALVPASHYRRDARVGAIMVEVNRGLYLHEAHATALPAFERIAQRIRQCCVEALASIPA